LEETVNPDSSNELSQGAPVFEIQIQVEPADIDQLGHVNNITYLRWVQEIAIAHWNATAPQEDKAKLLWVVLRHEIDYKVPAFVGETLLVKTWVGNASRLKFERHTEFVRASNNRSIAKALTVWCPIDSSTGKPVQVSPQVRACFSARSA
jgi:acyl-CoA thioester hydrolase